LSVRVRRDLAGDARRWLRERGARCIRHELSPAVLVAPEVRVADLVLAALAERAPALGIARDSADHAREHRDFCHLADRVRRLRDVRRDGRHSAAAVISDTRRPRKVR